MTKYIAIVTLDKRTQCYDAKDFEGKTVADIILKLQTKAENPFDLYIHTPLYCQILESTCVPTTQFQDLILNSSLGRYKRPNYYLLQVPSSTPHQLLISIAVRNQSKHFIPSFYSSFNLEELGSQDFSYIKEKVQNDFDIAVNSCSLFFDLEPISETDTALSIIMKAKTQQLVLDCDLTEKSISRLQHRVNILAEIISTEDTYIKCLLYIQNFWEAKMRERKLMPEESLQMIFKDIYAIIAAQTFFFNKIRELGSDYSVTIAEPFLEFSPIFKASQLYVSDYPMINEILMEYSKKTRFVSKMNKLTQESEGGDLNSYLITPVQRLPRYTLFLRDLLKYTPSSHPDSELLSLAFEQVTNITYQFDHVTAEARAQSELMELQKQISNQFIFLDRQREIALRMPITIPVAPGKIYQGTMLLFQDLILIVRTKGDRYRLLFDSEIQNFRCRYQWPDPKSFLVDSTKKSYGSRDSIYTISFETEENFEAVFQEIEKLRNKFILRSTEKYLLNFSNINVHLRLPNLVKPITVIQGNGTYVFSNNTIYKFTRETFKQIGQLADVDAAFATQKHVYIFAGGKLYQIEPPSLNPILMELEMPLPRLRGASMNINSKYILIFGGKIKRGDYSNILYIIDRRNKSVLKHEYQEDCMPPPRWHHGSVLFGNKLLIYGGSRKGQPPSNVYHDSYIFDLENFKWRPFELSLPPRKLHSMLYLGKYIIIIGGTYGKTQIIDIAKTENSQALLINAFSVGNFSPSNLKYSSAALMSTGDLFVLSGGHDDKSSFSSVFELYLPAIIKKSAQDDRDSKKKQRSNTAHKHRKLLLLPIHLSSVEEPDSPQNLILSSASSSREKLSPNDQKLNNEQLVALSESTPLISLTPEKGKPKKVRDCGIPKPPSKSNTQQHIVIPKMPISVLHPKTLGDQDLLTDSMDFINVNDGRMSTDDEPHHLDLQLPETFDQIMANQEDTPREPNLNLQETHHNDEIAEQNNDAEIQEPKAENKSNGIGMKSKVIIGVAITSVVAGALLFYRFKRSRS